MTAQHLPEETGTQRLRRPSGRRAAALEMTPRPAREVGQRTNVSIRPERVEFKSDKIPHQGHLIDAEVLEVIYMGDVLRTRMRVAGSDNFVMKCRNTLDQTRLSRGQKVRIGWHNADARALDPV